MNIHQAASIVYGSGYDQTLRQRVADELSRAGNSIEWFKCNCGEQSNLMWKLRGNSSHILGCCLDCAVKQATAQVKLGHLELKA